MIKIFSYSKSIFDRLRSLGKVEENRTHSKQGFTLLELLLVVAIIAILASVIFVVLDPPTRFKNARDASRFVDVTGLSNAIAIHQLDNGGAYLDTIAALTVDTVYMVSGATTTSGCIQTCDAVIPSGSNCVNLSSLVTSGNIGELPTSPNGTGTWTSVLRGYYIIRNENSSVTVGACESENVTAISVTQ